MALKGEATEPCADPLNGRTKGREQSKLNSVSCLEGSQAGKSAAAAAAAAFAFSGDGPQPC